MGRPLEFNKQDALEKAMQVFWKQGYEATSMQDLEQAMQLRRASIYGAFGNKRDLFLQVLDLYYQNIEEMKQGFVSAPTPLQGVLQYLKYVIDESVSDMQGYCCLTINTLVEMSSRDRELVEKANELFLAMIAVFHEALVKAQQQGEIDAQHDPQQLAQFIMTVVSGMRVMAQSHPGRRVLEGVYQTVERVLLSPPSSIN